MKRCILRLFWKLRLARWNRLHTIQIERMTDIQDSPVAALFEEDFHVVAARRCSLENKIAWANAQLEKLK